MVPSTTVTVLLSSRRAIAGLEADGITPEEGPGPKPLLALLEDVSASGQRKTELTIDKQRWAVVAWQLVHNF